MPWSPANAERQKARRQELRRERLRAGITGPACKRCGLNPRVCESHIGRCSKCGQQILFCIEALHQETLSCRAETAARVPASRGLVRSPSDGLVEMLIETGVRYEVHPSAVGRLEGHQPHAICEEAWVPPEAVAIVQQVNRSLDERMRALRKFAAWQARHAVG